MRFLSCIRGFSSLDVVTSICSVTAVALIAGPILKRNFESEGINRAEREMRELVPLILEKGGAIQEARGIANEDSQTNLGVDPWGQPYQYRLIKNSYGQPTHILVWSLGPNKAQDTAPFEVKPGPFTLVLEGDDLGFVRTLR